MDARHWRSSSVGGACVVRIFYADTGFNVLYLMLLVALAGLGFVV